MARIPSPELFRFLATHWPLAATSLEDVQEQLPTLASDKWNGFDPSEIETDLATAIPQYGKYLVKDIAKPIVLCLFANGQEGKTTFANLILKQGVPVVSTDRFVASLRDHWHENEELRHWAQITVPQCVNEFIKNIQANKVLADSFVSLFFAGEQGFQGKAPFSVVEGFLHDANNKAIVRLDLAIMKELRKRGYRVWTASRFNGE